MMSQATRPSSRDRAAAGSTQTADHSHWHSRLKRASIVPSKRMASAAVADEPDAVAEEMLRAQGRGYGPNALNITRPKACDR